MRDRRVKPLDPNPLLVNPPADLPPWRRAKGRGNSGGLKKYIEAVKPGPPPFGWRDITPYFGGIPKTVGDYNRKLRPQGYLLAVQKVTHNGQRYRRVAVVRIPPLPGFK